MVSGLTKKEQGDLKTALARLKSVNRPAYFGWTERNAVEQAIWGIEQRLSPKPVQTLLDTANRVAEPLEYLLKNIDRENAARELAEACNP